VSDLVAISNTLNLTNINVITLSTPQGPVPAGLYTLMTMANGTAGFGPFTLQSGYTNVALNTTANSVTLTVNPGGTYVVSPEAWRGNVNGTWDINATANWATNGVAATYADGNAVTFDDTLTGSTVVSNATPLAVVAPGSVLFNNNVSYLVTANMGGAGGVTKSGAGTATLAGANTYTSNTVINAGALLVTNGGSIYSPNGTLNIGATAGSAGTLTTASNSVITVQTVLATNVACGAPNNSILNLNGGSTLITSNYNGLAANILVGSNATWNVGGNWIMNAGTDILMNVGTNTSGAAGTVNFFNNLTNGLVQVNPNAVLLAIPANVIGATNGMNLNIIGTSNRFVVNGGQVMATNRYASTTTFGNGLFQINGTNNVFLVTNGGFVRTLTPNSQSGFGITGGSANSGLYVGGTNATGVKSMVIGSANIASERYNWQAGSYTNWLAVDSGGVVSNINFFGYNTTWVYVTNGGALYHNGFILGRSGYKSQMLVSGVDGAGNKSLVSGLFNNAQFTIGGGTGTPTAPSPGSNNWMQVDAGGVLTNAGYVAVGQDTNSWNNWLIITNGGQVYVGTAANSINGYGSVQGLYVGLVSGCFSNRITLGGGTNLSWLNLSGGGKVVIGNGGAGCSNNTVTVLSGGIVTNVNSIIFDGVNPVLNLNGGYLAAGANGNLIATNSTTINATNFVQAGGAIIDSVTYAATNVLPLLSDPNSTGGGLTKLGVGTLALLGANTYSGNTVVSAGTLALSGSASIATSPRITLAGGSVLDVSGLSSAFMLGGGQVLSNSASATATINGGFNTASGVLALTYAAGTPALAVTNGTVTLSGSTVFAVNNTGAALTANNYCLITNLAGGVVTGTLPLVTVGGGGIGVGLTNNLQVIGNALYLVVQSTAPVSVATTLGLSSSVNPSVNYAPVIFTATVLTNGIAATAATGNVVFLVDAVTVFTNGVNAGVAQYTNNLLTVVGSPHAVVAEYLGDANYGGSTNSSLSQVVTPPVVATNLTFNLTGGGTTLSFSWPTNYLGWGLQSNAVDLTVGGDWHLVPGSTNTTSVIIPVDPGQTNVFYRMVKP